MGYNPYRKFVRHRGDMVFVVAAIAVALALVLWTVLG